MSEDAQKFLDQFLNPEVVRRKFVVVGVCMMAHEQLKETIMRHPLAFYADDWRNNGEPIRSTDYENEILARDPMGKKDAFRGSVAWFKSRYAINEEDEKVIREFTDARNLIAHELWDVIAVDRMPDVGKLFPKIIELIVKIERWWIMNVEIDGEPEWTGKETKESDITPGAMILMQMLCNVALGDDEEAWELLSKVRQ